MKNKTVTNIFASLIILAIIGCSPTLGVAEPTDEQAVEQEMEDVVKNTETAEPIEETEVDEEASPEPVFNEELTDPIPVIFSHDGGSDDFAVLIYITRHPMINLIGVVQSYGLQYPSKTLESWQTFLYDVIDYDEAVFGLGSEYPLDPENNQFPEGWRGGTDAVWSLDLPEPSDTYSAIDGADLIVDLIKSSPEKVTMLVTGAQTDMALALQKDPSIVGNISQIVIMGGAFDMEGNLYESPGHEDNVVAEWNIYVDPLAAKIVFNSGVPLSIVSLDGSHYFFISPDDDEKISNSTDPALSLLSTVWQQQFQGWNGDFKIWDIVAAVALTNPEVIEWKYDDVDVIAEPGSTHGQTVALGTGSEIIRYSANTNYDLVREIIINVYLSD